MSTVLSEQSVVLDFFTRSARQSEGLPWNYSFKKKKNSNSVEPDLTTVEVQTLDAD